MADLVGDVGLLITLTSNEKVENHKRGSRSFQYQAIFM